MAGSTSAEAATDVGGRIFGREKRKKKRERRARREEQEGGEERKRRRGTGLENKVEGCPEPAVPLIIGVIP